MSEGSIGCALRAGARARRRVQGNLPHEILARSSSVGSGRATGREESCDAFDNDALGSRLRLAYDKFDVAGSVLGTCARARARPRQALPTRGRATRFLWAHLSCSCRAQTP